MDNFFEEGIEQFIRYQKDHEGKKTRQQKKKQKIKKLTQDLNDPALRKQRHRLRRQQQKDKLQKQLEGMNEEQARVYLDNKKQMKRLAKQRNIKALESGMPILIDAVFQSIMNAKQNKSLAIQVQLIMKSIKHMQDPPGIHLCSVGGGFKTQLQKMRYQHWTLTSSSDDVLEVAKTLNKKPIYLSPDAQDQLQQIDPNACYIIGGLVDRTVIKNASLKRAEELNIPAVRLPIRQFMKSRLCLNLDHVVTMVCKFKETKDWKIAFDCGAPKRWKRQLNTGNNEKKQQQLSQKSEKSQQQQKASQSEEQQLQIKEKQKQVQVKQQKQLQTQTNI